MGELSSLFQIIYLLVVFPLLVRGGAPDNAGTEFVFAFGSNQPSAGGTLEVFIATRKAHTVNFNYTKDGNIEVGSVTAGGVFSYEIADTDRMTPTVGSVIESKSQIIMADDDIVVYASNKQHYSADAFLVLPTDIQWTEYIVPSWGSTFENGGSLIVIAAIQDDTTVNITKGATTLLSNAVLNRGEVLQYMAAIEQPVTTTAAPTTASSRGRGRGRGKRSVRYKRDYTTIYDLTGARVVSDKPISVLSGNRRTFVGVSGSSDHIIEMIPPISTLGSSFFTSNFLERQSDIFRIIAAEDDVDLSVYRSSSDSVESYNMSSTGAFTEIVTSANEVMQINATGPVLVAQYSKTSAADGADSDPMMALVPPVEQFGNYYTFTTPSGVSDPYRNYVNLILKTSEIDGFRLDGAAVTTSLSDHGFNIGDTFDSDCWAQDSWTAITDSGYSTRTLAIVDGSHSIYHTNPIVSFNAVMYGQVIFESYGFPAGSRLASIGKYCVTSSAVASDGLDNDCDGVIDEELANGIDDDGDGSIDEDTSANVDYSATTTTLTTTTATTTATTPTTTAGAGTTGAPTTGAPTTGAPTTGAPTTGAPTTGAPTTGALTTGAPATTGAATTGAATTGALTTGAPAPGAATTGAPAAGAATTGATTTGAPAAGAATTGAATTGAPAPGALTTGAPTTGAPTTGAPTTGAPAAGAATTGAPTTGAPTTGAPTTGAPTTGAPTTGAPAAGAATTGAPTTGAPTTGAPTTGAPTTGAPTTGAPTTGAPAAGAATTGAPTTGAPTTGAPTTGAPTTGAPTTGAPAAGAATTGAPTTGAPTTGAPTTGAPTTGAPTTGAPAPGAATTGAPAAGAATTGAPTTGAPTTGAPTTGAPTTGAPTTGAAGAATTGAATTGAPTTGAPAPGAPTAGAPVAGATTMGAATARAPTTGASAAATAPPTAPTTAPGTVSTTGTTLTTSTPPTTSTGLTTTTITTTVSMTRTTPTTASSTTATTQNPDSLEGNANAQGASDNTQDIILGVSIPGGLALAALIGVSCFLIVAAIRRKRKKQEEDEEAEDADSDKSRPNSQGSNSSSTPLYPGGPGYQPLSRAISMNSNGTDSTSLNSSMNSKLSHRTGLGFPADSMRGVSPVDGPISHMNPTEIGEGLRNKTVSPSQLVPTLDW